MNTFEEFLVKLTPSWVDLLKSLLTEYFTRSIRKLKPDSSKLIPLEFLEYIKNNDMELVDDDGMNFKIHPIVADLLISLYQIVNPSFNITVHTFNEIGKLRSIKAFSDLITFIDDVRYTVGYAPEPLHNEHKKLMTKRLNGSYRKIKGTVLSIKHQGMNILPFSIYVTVTGACTRELLGPAIFVEYGPTSTLFYIKNLNSRRELWDRTLIEVSVPVELLPDV